MRIINKIIIHSSATPAGRPHTVADIERWHKERGFSKIGYHYVIYLDGSVHAGRPLVEAGAHCTGHNANSIGICYIGGGHPTPQDTRTDAQKIALEDLLDTLTKQFPNATVHGHRDLGSTSCPSFDVKTEL